MNPFTIDDSPIPLELPATLPFDKWPQRWQPQSADDRAHFEHGVRHLFADLLSTDANSDAARRQISGNGHDLGHPLRHVFNTIYQGNGPFHGLLWLGATKFNDFGGCFSMFARVLNQEVLKYTSTNGRKLFTSSGGGMGWPMQTSQEVALAVAKEMGLHPEKADFFTVLLEGKTADGAPNEIANIDLIVRGQKSLPLRDMVLMFGAEVCLICPGGQGTFYEHADVLLSNQMFSVNGPSSLGPRLIILLDSKLSDEACERARYEPGKREFDWFEERRRTMVAQNHAGNADFASVIKVAVDEDPEEAGKRTAAEIIKWFKLCRPVIDLERDAVKAALTAQ